jgi:hypothetical protein
MTLLLIKFGCVKQRKSCSRVVVTRFYCLLFWCSLALTMQVAKFSTESLVMMTSGNIFRISAKYMFFFGFPELFSNFICQNRTACSQMRSTLSSANSRDDDQRSPSFCPAQWAILRALPKFAR